MSSITTGASKDIPSKKDYIPARKDEQLKIINAYISDLLPKVSLKVRECKS